MPPLLGHDQVKFIFGPCHGDIKEPPFLIEVFGPFRRNTTINGVKDVNDFPFHALGRMDGRQD